MEGGGRLSVLGKSYHGCLAAGESQISVNYSSLNLSSFQENAHCTRLLYQHGYRIPQVGGDGNIREGEQEQKRKEIVMAEPSSDNQVRLQNQVEALSKLNIEYFPGGKIPCHGGLL